MKPHSKIRG